MEILSAEQIKLVDELTIRNEPISSIDLMERAAMACFRRLIKLIKLTEEVFVFCGKGNNGGDGLAIARLMIEQGFECHAVIVHYREDFSPDAEQNYQRLKEKYAGRIIEIRSPEELSTITSHGPVIVDALLGTGAKGPAEGLLADTIDFINTHSKNTISIDMPSGLLADASSSQHKQVVTSSLTLTFQLPKLAFLIPENQRFVPEFEILNIGLNQTAIQEQPSPYYYLTKAEVSSLLQPRNKFSHKGSYGHALLMAGSKGKSGAALIGAKAVLRSGAGLLTLHSTSDTIAALLQYLPEAMSVADANRERITELDHPEKYDAIGFGPGVGTHSDTQQVLKKLLQYYTGKLLIDADGLNILSENKTWLSFLPPDTILTPHPKEFERLAGKQEDDFERLTELKKFSMRNRCIVILKGAHSAVAMPDGTVFFNSSGNAGLAKGGSGDGLTGIILGLLARGYNAPQSALIGTFMHGFAADLCIKKKSMESLMISDVIEQLPKAFKKLE
jgi:hydroxyethylthiazole kinase-like uncharacterized protein yjeF